jgi:PPM family protein phosphatase
VQALPPVEYAERSHPGRDPDKQVNEDACACRETRFGHLCVVCDGMGGHAGGREAATLAVRTILESFDRAADGWTPAQVLCSAIEEANRAVHEMQTTEVAFGRPGSTVVAILMHAHGTEIAHVGDSRAYLIHHGQVSRVTRDHSLVQELLDRGLLTPEQAASHPDANRITRALGMAPKVEIDLTPQPMKQAVGDAFVLCTDGLSDLVEDHEIHAIVGGEPAVQAVVKLVDLANARGGHDNITVLVLRAQANALEPTTASGTVAQTTAAESGARSGRVSIGMAVAIVLSSVAVVLVGALFAVQFAVRSIHRNAESETQFRAAFEAGAASAPAFAPERLAPESAVFPSAGVPSSERMAPLEPAATAPRKKKR